METVPCCVCDSDRHVRVLAWIARDEFAPRIPGAPLRSRWTVCRDCGLVFQNPRPDAEQMARLYDGNVYRQWDEVPESFFAYARRRSMPMLEWLRTIPEVRDSLAAGAGVLDVGCGVGGALREMSKLGWQAYGVEPDPLLARAGTSRFGAPIVQDFMHAGLFPEQRFGMVFSIHTFEHLLDPLDVVRSARELLTRDGGSSGYIFIAVPTYAHATHGAWEWMNTSHTYLFSHASLTNLLARAGFRTVRWVYPEPGDHLCGEPSEVWVLASVDPAGPAAQPVRPEPPSRVQLRLATVPARWRLSRWSRRVKRIPLKLRSMLGFCKLMAKFACGYAVFRATAKTPHYAFDSMRQLYCRTNGRLNDLMASLSGFLRPGYEIAPAGGTLDHLGDTPVDQIVETVRRDGFYVFPGKLPAEFCDELQRFARDEPCQPYPAPPGAADPAPYDQDAWVAPKYDFEEQRVLGNRAVQRLVCDPRLLAIAQAYLGARPILDLVAMWWSTAYSREASSEAAQLYHFDMDRLKFVKFFIYLTDVGPQNGPHCYVAKSARRKPRPLLRDARVPDDELEQYYPRDDVHEIVGGRGTMFVADTRGFHKGKPLATGDRLLLQLEFSNSLFGTEYNTVELEDTDDLLLSAIERYPDVYSRITVGGRGPDPS